MKKSSLLDYGRTIIATEEEALRKLKESLDASFEHAARIILGMESGSHLIVSGMGKAGIIGEKISATFASVGVPSFPLHPAEAVHGDLGRFTKRDVALILSNSGETAEVLLMLPHLKKLPCIVISITGNPDSSLAKFSDVVLCIGKHDEAGPFGIAPTTSTTAMLALGDALAMTVIREKGLTKDEYAFYHPGGDIGRSLMRVKDVMRSGDELCVAGEELTVREVLHKISSTKGRPGAAALVDSKGVLTGIFTDGDLRRCLEKESSFLEKSVSNVMGRTPKTITQDKLAGEALSVLHTHRVDQVIVVDESKKPIGLVDIQDLVELKFLSSPSV